MNYANNAFSVLNGAISNVATTITLATGTGSRFPASDFRVTLIGYDGLGNENAWEICHCTSRSGDVLTVTRAQEGTTAVAWANATRIENRLTAGSISGGIAYTRKTAAYTLGDKEGIIADTTGGSFIVKLPASPSAGIQCFIADGADWSVNNLTVDPQGATIESLAAGETVVLNIGGLSAQFLHDGTKWNMHVTATVVSGGNVVTTSATQTLTNKVIDFASNTLTGVASTNTTQTLTNKTLTAPVITGATAEMVSQNGGQLAGLRNKIINGKMEIAQRGTSFPAIASGVYSLDRWWVVTDSVGTVNVSQVDVSTTGTGFSKAIRAERTAGTQRWVIGQNLETSEVISLRGKKVTLSFLVRKGAALTSDLSVFFGTSTTEAKFGGAVDFVIDNVPNASISTSAFAAFSFTLDIPANSTAPGFYLQFQCDQAGAANAYFEITGVQLEVGPVATPFEHRPYGMELDLCQRYYQRIIGTSGDSYGTGTCNSTTLALIHVPFAKTMRVAPSAVEHTGVASDYQIRAGSAVITASVAPAFLAATDNGALIDVRAASGLSGGNAAILRSNVESTFLGFPAEL